MKQMWPLIILGVLMVVMMVATIIPQRKKQKKAQEMMNALRAGDKVKTIGGFVGIIKAIDNTTNTILLDIGAEGSETLVTIDRNAIYTSVTEPVQQATATAVEEVFQEEEVTTADDVVADKKGFEQKQKKSAKKTVKADVAVDANVDVVTDVQPEAADKRSDEIPH